MRLEDINIPDLNVFKNGSQNTLITTDEYRELWNKRNDFDKYKQVLIEIREYIYKNSATRRFKPKLSIDNDFEFKGNAEDILQIIEKGLGEDNG